MFEYEAFICADWPQAKGLRERLRVQAHTRAEMYDTVIAYVQAKGGTLHTIIRTVMVGNAAKDQTEARVL